MTASPLLAVLAQVAAVLFVLLLSAAAAASALVLQRMRASPYISSSPQPPPISIIKPLCGAPEWLEQALRTWFTLSTGAPMQIVFVAADHSDPAWEVVAQLQHEFPERDVSRVITGPAPTNWLLKTWNLESGVTAARHDLLLLVDADTLADREVVLDLVLRLQCPPKPGLRPIAAAYAHPVVARAQGIGGIFDAAVTNFTTLLIQPLLNKLGIDELSPFCLISRATLQKAGGFRAIQKQIADDISLGRCLKNLGYRLSLSPFPISTVSSHMSFSEFFTHQTRWLVTWRVSAGFSAAFAFLYSSTAFAVAGLLLSTSSRVAWAIVAGVALAEMILMLFVEFELNLRTPSPLQVVLAPFALLAQQFIALASAFTNRVRWAGTSYQLNRRGTILRRWQ